MIFPGRAGAWKVSSTPSAAARSENRATNTPDRASFIQVKKETVTLPVVSPSHNGSGIAATTETHYDAWGYVEKRVNELGIVTKFTYDRARGGLTQRMANHVDPAPSPLPADTNLTTDYLIDDLGRPTERLNPAHQVNIAGVATGIRSAVWTHYKDAENEVVIIRGYKIGNDAHPVNPMSISRSFEPDPGLTGGSMTSQIAAEYAGSGTVSWFSRLKPPSPRLSPFPGSRRT